MHKSSKIHDFVILTDAIPTLWLKRGVVGVVQSVWSSSPKYYEVEFPSSVDSVAVRALLRAEQLEIIDRLG